MIRLENPQFLWALCLIPIFIIIFILKLKWRKRSMAKMGDPLLVKSLIPLQSDSKTYLKFILQLFAFSLLIIGIANPQLGSKYEASKSKGIDLIIALDVSNSMMAEDIAPNRLERAKQAINKLLENMEDDRIGIVVFAAEAYLQLPLTQDYAAAKLFLSHVSNQSISSQGTKIAKAIQTSAQALSKGRPRSSAIVILTDGENHEEEALQLAKSTYDSGIPIYTIGIGSDEGSPVPEYENNIKIGFKKDMDGNPVSSRLNSNLLANIAESGGGKFIMASTENFGLEELLNQLKKIGKTELGNKIFTEYIDRFYYFLASCLLILFIEFFLKEKKNESGMFDFFKNI